jgi:hypothetical protein
METASLVVARMIIFVVRASFAVTILIMMMVAIGAAVGELLDHEGVPDPGPSRNEVSEVLHRSHSGVDPSVVIPLTHTLIIY